MGNAVTPGISLYVTAGTSPSAAVALPGGSGQQLIVANFGTVKGYIAWGDNTVAAVLTGSARSYAIPASTVQTITIGNAGFISYGSDSAAQDMQFTRASGE